MYVNLPPGDLNSGPCPLHPTSTYTCKVIIVPRMCGGMILAYWNCLIGVFSLHLTSSQ